MTGKVWIKEDSRAQHLMGPTMVFVAAVAPVHQHVPVVAVSSKKAISDVF